MPRYLYGRVVKVSRYCVPCAAFAYLRPRLTIPEYIREFLAGRLAPSGRRLAASVEYLAQGYSVTNRHDERRWLRRLDEHVSIAADALELERPTEAVAVLDQLLPDAVVDRLLTRAVYGDNYVGPVLHVRHELVRRGRVSPLLRAKVFRLEGAAADHEFKVGDAVSVGYDVPPEDA